MCDFGWGCAVGFRGYQPGGVYVWGVEAEADYSGGDARGDGSGGAQVGGGMQCQKQLGIRYAEGRWRVLLRRTACRAEGAVAGEGGIDPPVRQDAVGC